MNEWKVLFSSFFFIFTVLLWTIPWFLNSGLLNIGISMIIVLALIMLIWYKRRYFEAKKEFYRFPKEDKDSVSLLWRSAWRFMAILFLSMNLIGLLHSISLYLIDRDSWKWYAVTFAYLFYLSRKIHKESYFSFLHLFSYPFAILLILMGVGALNQYQSGQELFYSIEVGSYSFLATFQNCGVLLTVLLPVKLMLLCFQNKKLIGYSLVGMILGLLLCIMLSIVVTKEGVLYNENALFLFLNPISMGHIVKRLDIWIMYVGMMGLFLLLIGISVQIHEIKQNNSKIRDGITMVLLFLSIWVLWIFLPTYTAWLKWFLWIMCGCGYFMLAYFVRESL